MKLYLVNYGNDHDLKSMFLSKDIVNDRRKLNKNSTHKPYITMIKEVC